MTRAAGASWAGCASGRSLPGSRPAPVLLIASNDFARHCRVDGWAAVVPNLTVHRMPGSHLEIFRPAALEVLNPALLAALERSATA